MRTRLCSLITVAIVAALATCGAATATPTPTPTTCGDAANGNSTLCPPAKATIAVPTAVTATTATLNAAIVPGGIPAVCQYQYGTTTKYGSVTGPRVIEPTSSDPWMLAGLNPATTYHVRAMCANASAARASYSMDLAFRTAAKGSGSAPAVSTSPATAVTAGGATLNGTVTPGSSAATCQFVYTAAYVGSGNGTAEINEENGVQGVPTATRAVSVPAGGSAVTVTIPVGNLPTGDSITEALSCSNSAGTGTGTSMSLQTLNTTTAPQPITGYPTSLASTGATLYGQVNPEAFGATCHFEYGTTPAYGTETAAITESPQGTVLEDNTMPVAGLTPNTVYHYNFACKNSQGNAPTQGGDETFTTPASGNAVLPKAAVSHPSIVSAGRASEGTVIVTIKCGFGTPCVGRLSAHSPTPASGHKHGAFLIGKTFVYSVPAAGTKKVRLKLYSRYANYIVKHNRLKATIAGKDRDNRRASKTTTLT